MIVRTKQTISKNAALEDSAFPLWPELLRRFARTGEPLEVFKFPTQARIFVCNSAGEALLCSEEEFKILFEEYPKGLHIPAFMWGRMKDEIPKEVRRGQCVSDDRGM